MKFAVDASCFEGFTLKYLHMVIVYSQNNAFLCARYI